MRKLASYPQGRRRHCTLHPSGTDALMITSLSKWLYRCLSFFSQCANDLHGSAWRGGRAAMAGASNGCHCACQPGGGYRWLVTGFENDSKWRGERSHRRRWTGVYYGVSSRSVVSVSESSGDSGMANVFLRWRHVCSALRDLASGSKRVLTLHARQDAGFERISLQQEVLVPLRSSAWH